MSGKSRLLVNVSASFYPYFVNRPISEIIYVGHSWETEYEERLMAVGEALGVPVHMCRGGLSSDVFRRSWERKRRRVLGSSTNSDRRKKDGSETANGDDPKIDGEDNDKDYDDKNFDDEDIRIKGKTLRSRF